MVRVPGQGAVGMRQLNRPRLLWLRWLCFCWLPALIAEPVQSSLLWQLEKDDKVHYLFGTIHISDPEVIQLPPSVESVVNSASALVVEVVLDSVTRQAIAERTLLSSSTLKQVLGIELFGEVARVAKQRGMPSSSLLRLKPWAVGLMLNVPTPSLEPVLDVHLQYRFADTQRPVYGLETIDEQLDIFDEMTLDDQIAFLKTSLAQQADFDVHFSRMKTLYLAGDLEQIERFAREQSSKSANSTMDKLMYRILEERNHRMFARVQSHLAQSGVLIAVGALHLPGQQGLLQMFRNAGYSVRAVTP